METLYLEVDGLRFAARAWGRGPAVLLLHGFPDDADTWAAVGPALAAAGYRAVAPWLRGYAPSEVPRAPSTPLATLADDVVALAAAVGARVAVGHDWGAAGVYAAAARHPGALRGLVGLSVPPLPALLRSLSLGQVRRSAYMLAFQVPGIEAVVRARDFALIGALWRAWSPTWTPPPGRLAAVKATLAAPGTLTAALGYYRGLPRSVGLLQTAEPGALPHRLLVGADDGCIAPGTFARVPHTVVPGAGHFLPLEAPAAVVAATCAVLTEAGIEPTRPT